MNAPAYDKTPEAYRYASLQAAGDDLERRHRATDELCREVEELLVILKALATGASYQSNDEPVDAYAFLHLAERLERAFTAVGDARTREWPTVVIVRDSDLHALERSPGALFGVERLDGKPETPIPA